MGTTNTTTGSNSSTMQFDPASKKLYDSLSQGGGKVMSDYMNNPFGNAFYSMGAAQSQKGAQQQGMNNMQSLMQNQLTSGLGGQAGAGWLSAQKAQTGRANSSMMSQANQGNVLAALQRQMQAAGTGLSYQPLLTGQSGNFSQQQSTSGLGTWLPQLAGAAMGAASGFATGGASKILGGMMSGGSVGGSSDPGLGAPSYMPGGGGMSSAFPGFGGGMTGAIPGYMPMQPPTVSPFMNYMGLPNGG